MMSNEAADYKFSHVGICVTDLACAMQFYGEGLGFQPGAQVNIENTVQNLVGVEGDLVMQCQFMRLGDMVIELIQFATPATVKETDRPRAMNRTGFTHLSFRVDDAKEKAAKLEAFGGTIVHSTAVWDEAYGGNLLFCLDPDGNRIELMDYPSEISFA